MASWQGKVGTEDPELLSESLEGDVLSCDLVLGRYPIIFPVPSDADPRLFSYRTAVVFPHP